MRNQGIWKLWHQRLFSNRWNTGTTLVIAVCLAWAIPPLARWAFFDATFSGDSRAACTVTGREGACWVFIRVRFWQFMYGLYPEGERWRANAVLGLLLLGVTPLLLPMRPSIKRWFGAIFLALFSSLAFAWLYGGFFGLVQVDTSLWGGLMLTLIISSTGIIGSLPLGILLALGRRSHLPFIRSVSVAFIELWRGVPLITVLFMASVMLPLFLPREIQVDKLVRALVGTTLFASAYMAEVVRGGLQAIPKGQLEAAESLGLNYWQTTGLIVLPQALRLVIPGIVNTFIGLVKDTSLVLIIGMFDLLGMIQAASTDPNWLGTAVEGYVFAGCCFWIICYGLSRYSQHLEGKLRTEVRT